MKLYNKILVGTVLFGTMITGILKALDNIGKEVYRGEINRYSIVYEEGRPSIGRETFFDKNIMNLKKGTISYEFKDVIDENVIDWKNEIKPNLEKDKLEKIILKIGDESKTYSKPHINNSNSPYYNNIDYRINEEIFSKSNLLYSSLREKIREELRNKYQQEQKIFTDAIKK